MYRYTTDRVPRFRFTLKDHYLDHFGASYHTIFAMPCIASYICRKPCNASNCIMCRHNSHSLQAVAVALLDLASRLAETSPYTQRKSEKTCIRCRDTARVLRGGFSRIFVFSYFLGQAARLFVPGVDPRCPGRSCSWHAL